jgi:hypothetical protein
MDEAIRGMIEGNIRDHGFHFYMVKGGLLPRFIYSIGLSGLIGRELILPGALYFSDAEAIEIFTAVSAKLRECGVSESVELDRFGVFSLGRVDESWADSLMLGCSDYFGGHGFEAVQIVPDADRMTCDVPDMSYAHSPDSDLPWKWITVPWGFQVPEDSTAITNIDSLQGYLMTECVRWEDGAWEIFSGSGPDVAEADMRSVPLALLLAEDPTLEVVVDLKIGEGVWRTYEDQVWHEWKSRSGGTSSPS